MCPVASLKSLSFTVNVVLFDTLSHFHLSANHWNVMWKPQEWYARRNKCYSEIFVLDCKVFSMSKYAWRGYLIFILLILRYQFCFKLLVSCSCIIKTKHFALPTLKGRYVPHLSKLKAHLTSSRFVFYGSTDKILWHEKYNLHHSAHRQYRWMTWGLPKI